MVSRCREINNTSVDMFNTYTTLNWQADQTPTPTRLIRNLDEIGLFEEIIVNPFDETFRRAVEAKSTSSTTNEVLASGTAGGKGGGGGRAIGSGGGAADDDDCDLAKVQSDAETLNTPHVMPYHDVTAADCRFVASPMDPAHRTLCETVEKWRSAVAQSAPTMSATVDKLKSRFVRKLSRPASPPIIIGCPSPMKMPKLVKLSPPTTSIALLSSVRQRANHPIAVQARMPKLVQLSNAPATTIDLTAETVREKLKRQIVEKQHTSDVESANSPVPVATSTPIGTSVSSEENNIPPPDKCESPCKSCVEPDAASTGHRFERNRAAAQRYRSKMKKGRMEMQTRNDRLEEENRSLRDELQKVKALLLAHQTCSVTKAMAQGRLITRAFL